ncbi:MAG TPA: hypothetical protein VFQ76_01840 [Longimicrobiaceae bacterium]|nr:hypothetical protein [Longimicrobiaceae bacterium]
MRPSPFLLLAALAACDLPWDVTGTRIANLEVQTQAAPAGAAQDVVVSGESRRIVIRGRFEVPAAHELRSYAQRHGGVVFAFVHAADYPVSTAPARTLRYEATLRDLPRGTYVVRVSHFVQSDPQGTMREVASDTVAVVP